MNFDATRALIHDQLATSVSPIVACSFGKDSIVLLHLVLSERRVPVLYFKLSRFQEKHAHAYQVMREWDLEVHEQLPFSTDYLQTDRVRELFEFYRTGPRSFLLLALGAVPRGDTDDRFLCAIDDVYLRPHASQQDYPWDTTFLGHKAADPVKFLERRVLALDPVQSVDGTRIVCPLHDWTDADIWGYIQAHRLPYDRARYEEGNYVGDPDYYPTCFRCLDTAHRGELVWCPKYQRQIPSVAREAAAHQQLLDLVTQQAHYLHLDREQEGVI